MRVHIKRYKNVYQLTRRSPRRGVVDGRAVAGASVVGHRRSRASEATGIVEGSVVVAGVVVRIGDDARGHRRSDSKETGLHRGFID